MKGLTAARGLLRSGLGVRASRACYSSKRAEREASAPTIPKTEDGPALDMTDQQLIEMVQGGKMRAAALEKELGDYKRAVKVRRSIVERNANEKSEGGKRRESKFGLSPLPWKDIDYSLIHGACCENVVGYVPIPVGVAGPVNINGEPVAIPMATTEGCLVASTHRGCKAINEGGGATVKVLADGMTRGPVVKMPSAARAFELKRWLEFQENVFQVASAFNSTSRFARLSALKVNIAGPYVFIRFKSTTGDAMGMNMISKGVEKALVLLAEQFPDMNILSVSGNFCTDKKATALNWIDGRGKSVVAEATIPKGVVKKTLKTTVDAVVELNVAKNLIGSAMSGAVGGFNAHASNLVTAVFLATGQDPAQNVESSQCIDVFEKTEDGDLHVSVTMPSIEVGTIGGGTGLPAQSSMLDLVGVKGTSTELPGTNSKKLAQVVATSVLAGELSLMSALAAGHLVKAHMEHNRKQNKKEGGVEEVLLKGTLYGQEQL